jgi:hypothetical protein
LGATALDAVTFTNVDYVQCNYHFLNGLGVAQYCERVDALGVLVITGGMTMNNCASVNTTIEAQSCSATALSATNCHAVIATLNANGCTATPLNLVNIHYFTTGGLTGSTGGTTYGATISGGGQYVVTGATISGTSGSQFTMEGVPGDWATLSAAGDYALRGTFIHWGSGNTVWQGKLSIPANGGDELTTNDITVGGSIKDYGLFYRLGPAYTEITAHVGGGQGSATLVGLQASTVTACASDHDSVRLYGSADISIVGGLDFVITNATAKIVDVYPPTGKKLIVNGADLGIDNPLSLGVLHQLRIMTANDGNYYGIAA